MQAYLWTDAGWVAHRDRDSRIRSHFQKRILNKRETRNQRTPVRLALQALANFAAFGSSCLEIGGEEFGDLLELFGGEE